MYLSSTECISACNDDDCDDDSDDDNCDDSDDDGDDDDIGADDCR